ncbi:hypothetical protein FACS1894109_10620 [Spirochaetia bacterium]|nr:hypothetical protein FACS1894109_10620 [Spirochaetia bacterium]
MRGKILIPRRDHEVYFIPFRKELKKKEYCSYIQENLYHMHPGFSESSVFDIQKIVLNKEPWFMATVMVQDVLTPYRIANPRGLFFTSTTLLTRQKSFTETEPCNLSDEQIGYNKEKKEPFSLPLTGGPEKTAQDNAVILSLLKKAPGGCSVFNRKSARMPLLAAVCALAVISASTFLFLSGTKKPVVEIVKEPASVETVQKENMPGPFDMFANIAYLLYQNKGVILQWQYDRQQNPAFVISVEGIEPNNLPAIFSPLRYVDFNSISDIKYSGNTPQYTLNLSVNTSAFIIPSYVNMTGQETIFPILDSFHSELGNYHVRFLTEVLPAEQNGFDSCSISISCPSNEFVPVLELIETILSKHRMGLNRMTLALNKNDNVFSFSWSFSPYSRDYQYEKEFSSGKYNELPAAFGHKPKPPEQQNTDVTGLTKIGLIKDEDGLYMAYYRDKAGKIISRGNKANVK